ncbi:MAG: hypothetical protein H7332_03525 [Bdellovibrionales bacterium]|nr:hypothetical protein [Ramlibacter sp.]
MDISKPYLDRPTDTQADFDEVARQVPSSALAGGLADAFRSDKTPDFGQMAASLFGGSNGQQQAGLLSQLIKSVILALLSSVAGGALGRMFQGSFQGSFPGSASSAAGVPAATQISASDLSQLTPDQVRELATEAQRQDPGVLDRVGAFYAEHLEVVKVLGGAALAIALGQVATRVRR